MSKIDSSLSLLLLISIPFLTFYNMLDNFFLRDEVTYLKGTLSGFKSGILSYEQVLPVVVVIHYYINLPLWGLNPGYFYLQNLVIHIINVLLFYNICLFLFEKTMENPKIPAVVSSVLFSVIFSHNEAILYLNGFPTLLSTLFILSSFVSYHLFKTKENKIFYILSFVFFTLSVFSHPAAIVFLFIFIVYDILFFKRMHYTYYLKLSIPFVLGTFLYIYISFIYKTGASKSYFINILNYNFQFLKVFAFYIFDFFLSLVGLTSSMLYYDPTKYIITSHQKFLFILRYIAITFLFLLAILAFKTRKNKVDVGNLNRIILFGALWCTIAFLPYTTRDIIIFETILRYRYLYLPAVGFSIFIGSIFYFLYRKFKNSKLYKSFLFITIFVIILVNTSFVYLREKDMHIFSENFKSTFLGILSLTHSRDSYVYLIDYPQKLSQYYKYPLKDLVGIATEGKVKIYFADEEDIPCHCVKKLCYFLKMKEDEKLSDRLKFTDVSERYRKIILQECK